MMKNKYLLTGVVQEMAANAGGQIKLSPKVDIQKLTEGDSDPMFVTVEVLNPTVSANKRRWTPELMADVAKQINDKLPDGYMGHIKEEDRASAHPEPQTMWVGAQIVNVDGTPRLVAKGYVYPYAEKLRTYLKKAVAAGKQIAVSVYGEALQLWNKVDKLYDIREFDLESIDWARSGSQGVTPALVPVIAGEQTDPNMKTKEEIIAELTLEELKAARPDLIEALKAEVTPAPAPANPEPAPANPEPTPAPENGEVKEMRGILGLEDGKSVVAEMKAREDERIALLDTYLDSKVRDEIGRESLRPVFKKMVVAEMKAHSKDAIDNALDAVLKSEEGKTLIAEMASVKPLDSREDNRNNRDSRKYTKIQ